MKNKNVTLLCILISAIFFHFSLYILYIIYSLCIFFLHFSTFCSLTFQTNICITLHVSGRNLGGFQKYPIYAVFDCGLFFGDAISIRSQDLLWYKYIVQNKQTKYNINIKYITLFQHTHFILLLKKYCLLVILRISFKDLFRAKKNKNILYLSTYAINYNNYMHCHWL